MKFTFVVKKPNKQLAELKHSKDQIKI